jgi:hypothetical protein
VILFFWPMRASSWNQISIVSTSTAFSRATWSRRAGSGAAGRELAITHGPQLPAQGLLGNGDAELLEDPLRQIDQPPSHHPVDSRDRASLDHPLNGSALDVIKLRGLARRFAVQKTVGASRIEAEHPIADDLKSHAPDLRCLAARCTVIDRRKRQ